MGSSRQLLATSPAPTSLGASSCPGLLQQALELAGARSSSATNRKLQFVLLMEPLGVTEVVFKLLGKPQEMEGFPRRNIFSSRSPLCLSISLPPRCPIPVEPLDPQGGLGYRNSTLHGRGVLGRQDPSQFDFALKPHLKLQFQPEQPREKLPVPCLVVGDPLPSRRDSLMSVLSEQRLMLRYRTLIGQATKQGNTSQNTAKQWWEDTTCAMRALTLQRHLCQEQYFPQLKITSLFG